MTGLENASVLVTGGSGFIGTHLVERLVTLNAKVRCLVRHTSALGALPPSRLELCYGDLASGEGLAEAVAGIDTVFHLAGVTKALRRQQYYDGNARASLNLARACEGRPLQFVHVSSLAAIGPSTSGAPVEEDDTPQPLTDYGKSKLQAEEAVRHLLPQAVIVRPPVVYGPRDTDVYQVFRGIHRGLMPRIGRGEAWFSIVYVKDLADGLIAAARSERAAGRSYFLAQPKPVSWSEFAAVAAEVMERKVKLVTLPRAVAYAGGLAAELRSKIKGKPGILSRDKVRDACCRYWTCDTHRAERELGFTASTPLRAGIAETIAWYREAGWLT